MARGPARGFPPYRMIDAEGGDGRSGGTRTHGIRFWRPTLYQLSYTPIRHSSLERAALAALLHKSKSMHALARNRAGAI